jgi:hypothetical protein
MEYWSDVAVLNAPRSVPEGLDDGSLARSAWKTGGYDPSCREGCECGQHCSFIAQDKVTSLPTDHTVPSGTESLFRRLQALRARLPSWSPFGTKDPGEILSCVYYRKAA